MTAIRAIFDGKTFIPQEPVHLAAQAEAIVQVDSTDSVAQARLDDAVRAYYQAGPDVKDEAWARATERDSLRAWEED